MSQNTIIHRITGKEMIHIPAGKFLFGEAMKEREQPGFWIDKTPVTNAEYKRFCTDMAGNVWEWTATRDDIGWIVRGGSFINDRGYARCALREWGLPDSGVRLYGFRVTISAP